MELLINRAEQGVKDLELETDLRYGVAFSAGPDSTFLLHLLKRCGFSKLYVLYVNYHDSPNTPKEEELVYKDVEKYNVRIVKEDAHMKGTGENFEATARNIRYKFFSKCCGRYNLEGVFVAHQEDDLLTTYLMQKIRGGIVDYYGIAPYRVIEGVNIFRPLLDISKEDIIGYLNFNKIPYYDDVTNKNISRTRNWLRENMLPSLNREETKKEIAKANEDIDKRVESLKPLIKNGTLYSDYYALPEDLKLTLIISILLSNANHFYNHDRILASRNLIYENLKRKDSTELTHLPLNVTMYRNYDCFYLQQTSDMLPYSHKVFVPGVYDFKEVKVDLTDPSIFKIKASDFPLTIRTVRPDDKFATSIVNKSVVNFLKSQKVPSYLRNFYPVIVSKNDKILYVPFIKDVKEGKIPFEIKDFIL